MDAPTTETCACPAKNLTCTSTSAQYAEVCVPVQLKPYAVVGKPETECCGEPIVTVRPSQGASGACGCDITILQTLCIHIPVTYGTTADVGETAVNCRRPQTGCTAPSSYR